MEEYVCTQSNSALGRLRKMVEMSSQIMNGAMQQILLFKMVRCIVPQSSEVNVTYINVIANDPKDDLKR